MPTFSPIDPLLLDIDSAASAVSAIVQVSPDPDPMLGEVLETIRVEHYLPTGFVVDVDEALFRVTVTAVALHNAFPAELIRYRAGNALGEVQSFAQLPPDTDNIIAFRPGTGTRTFGLTVYAKAVGGVEVGATYAVQLEANFNSGRAALLAAIAEYG